MVNRDEFIFGEWVLRPLAPDLQVSRFDCGDLEMNTYFRRKSKKYRRQLLVQSYHFCPIEYTGTEPIVLVDLCNDVVCRKILPDMEVIPEKKRYLETFPAVKIARLGRNVKFRGLGASAHLFNALKMFFTRGNRTGCRFLTLDAYKERVGLYESCGFIRTLIDDEQESQKQTVSMLLDLLPFSRLEL